jgi:O-antigen/teichoic acid export membrane protein
MALRQVDGSRHVEENRLIEPRRGGLVSQFLANRTPWVVGDQALLSGSSFLGMLVLARGLDASAFGSVVMGFTAIQVGTSVQSALVTQPHSVFGAQLDGQEYRDYTVSAALAQLALASTSGGLVLVGSFAAGMGGWGAERWLGVLAAAVAAWQLQEFFRRVLYTENRPAAAFVSDIVSYGGQVAGLVALAASNQLSIVSAFVTVGATSILGMLVGLAFARGALLGRPRRGFFGQNWRYGRWLLGAQLASWTSGLSLPVLIASLVSLADAGIFRAVQLVLGPTHVLLKAIETAETPRAARAWAYGGQLALRTHLQRTASLTAPLMLAYCLVVATFAGPVLRLLYGEQYAGYAWLLSLFAAAYALEYLVYLGSVALNAAGQSAPIFRAYALSSGLVLTIGAVLIMAKGLAGAMLVLLAHMVVLNLCLWKHIRPLLGRSR